MKKKKHKGNPYRDPKTGQFASRKKWVESIELDDTCRMVVDAPKHGWNWFLISLIAGATVFWVGVFWLLGVI